MTFGRVAEALPRAIRLVGWPKLVIFFLIFFFGRNGQSHIKSEEEQLPVSGTRMKRSSTIFISCHLILAGFLGASMLPGLSLA